MGALVGRPDAQGRPPPGSKVRALRSKLWTGRRTSAKDWDDEAVATWMDGRSTDRQWDGWGKSTLNALRAHPHAGKALRQRPRVLDFGCGPGQLVALLQPLCKRVVGLDVAEAMTRALRARAVAGGWENVDAVCADITALDSGSKEAAAAAVLLRAAGPFDLITAVTVIQFVRHQAKVLEVLGSLLAPGGTLVHLDWSGSGIGCARGARKLYKAAGLREIHSGGASIKGWGLFAGSVRRRRESI